MKYLIRKTKKVVTFCIITTLLITSISVSALGLVVTTNSSLLKKTAKSVATSAIYTEVVIYKKDNSVLASKGTGQYSSNGTRTAEASYTGVSSASYAQGMAINLATKTTSQKANY